MTMLKNKKLLILGGTSASLDIVKVAKSMGVYTVVTDDQQCGVAKDIADEACMVSTTDMDGLLDLIRTKSIDGVFCGPSEFNILNAMRICELAGLPFYCTREQWDICSNKASFKRLCREYGVPCVSEYKIDEDIENADLSHITYPVIVKPVDGCSSKGITVCNNDDELRKAYKYALTYSQCKDVIIEKYIQNNCDGLSVRYIANDGSLYLSLIGDRYVVDPFSRTSLISAAAIFPSKYTELYIETIDANVRKMFQGLGIKNGTFFMQALIDEDKIYFHEMGLRLSGGLTYKLTEPLNGINDVKMMIRYALGGPMCTPTEIENISPYLNGNYAGSLCLPLKAGIIGDIKGLDEIKRMECVSDFVQYYNVGDLITEDKIGTLMQHFGRVKIVAKSKEDIITAIDKIQDTLRVVNQEGQDMLYMRFDTRRMLMSKEHQ